MDEHGFERYLKRSGKKEHVIAGRVDRVRRFEAFLADTRRVGLEEVGPDDLDAYIGYLRNCEPSELKGQLRAIALYTAFVGDEDLASHALGVREEEIETTRSTFRLRDFLDVNPEQVETLRLRGIVNAEQMLTAGKTIAARQQLADETGIPVDAILELVKLSDLSRMRGCKAVRARLYYDAGLDTPEKIAQSEPEALRAMLAEYIERTGFDGIPPLPTEARKAVEGTRRIEKVVEYE